MRAGTLQQTKSLRNFNINSLKKGISSTVIKHGAKNSSCTGNVEWSSWVDGQVSAQTSLFFLTFSHRLPGLDLCWWSGAVSRMF